MSCLQARDKRNSFAKTVYNQLFSWLVEKVNLTISPVANGLIKGMFFEVVKLYNPNQIFMLCL